jgi:hypothetical protein
MRAVYQYWYACSITDFGWRLGASTAVTQSAYLNGRYQENSRAGVCPLRTVEEAGSGRSPGTLENEELPFAMR